MAAPAHLIELAQHLEWADAAVWRAVLDCAAARTDARITGWLRHSHVFLKKG